MIKYEAPRCAHPGCTATPAWSDASGIYRCNNRKHWPLRLRLMWILAKLTSPRFHLSWHPDFEGLGWFNIGAPVVQVNSLYVRAWNAFRRVCANGERHAGAGILQIGSRHLLYTGTDCATPDGEANWRMCVAFVWLVGRRP